MVKGRALLSVSSGATTAKGIAVSTSAEKTTEEEAIKQTINAVINLRIPMVLTRPVPAKEMHILRRIAIRERPGESGDFKNGNDRRAL